MVTHIVLFKFASTADAEIARKKLLSMAGKVPSLQAIEVGLDYIHSERSFQLGLITRHESREALEAYRVDPLHVEVGAFIREKSTGAASVDFEIAD